MRRTPWRVALGGLAAGLGIAILLTARTTGWSAIDRPVAGFRGGTDTLRIAALGTSLTANGMWPNLIGPALADCLGRPVEVVRIAKPGANSDWGLSAVAEVVQANPDLVLIEFSINDADLRDGLSLATSEERHAAILERLGAALPQARVVLMTMNPAYGLRAMMRPRLAAYYRLYERLSEGSDIGVVDTYARWLALPDVRKTLPDGLHPDPDKAAEIIVPALTQAVGRAAQRDCIPVNPQPAGSG